MEQLPHTIQDISSRLSTHVCPLPTAVYCRKRCDGGWSILERWVTLWLSSPYARIAQVVNWLNDIFVSLCIQALDQNQHMWQWLNTCPWIKHWFSQSVKTAMFNGFGRSTRPKHQSRQNKLPRCISNEAARPISCDCSPTQFYWSLNLQFDWVGPGIHSSLPKYILILSWQSVPMHGSTLNLWWSWPRLSPLWVHQHLIPTKFVG